MGTVDEYDGDIVIVGAGPVGMTAALLLEHLGLRVVVLERASGPSSEPKAISLDDVSLRAFQFAGIAQEVLGIIVPGTGTKYFGADGKPLFHARGPEPYRIGHPFKNPFAQPDLEALLRRVILTKTRIMLHYDTAVSDVVQDSNSVSAVVKSGSSARIFRGSYLIGADGGRSTVRQSVGIEMVGRGFEENWLVVDTFGDRHDERYGMHYGVPGRPHVIVPGLDGRCRYEFLLHDGEGAPGEPPELELIQTLLRPYRHIVAEEVERAVAYRFNSLLAQSWRCGRVFLAGDAAHMMPPFAGQGLNSGIRDVLNLAWKLASAVNGGLTDESLDSYELERVAHARSTIKLSERLGRVVMTTSPRLARWRDSTVRDAIKTPEGKVYLEEMQYRPSATFTAGLIDPEPRSQLIGTEVPQPRAFDMSARAVVMLDDALGSGWSIVGVDVDPEQWVHVRRVAALTGATLFELSTSDRLSRGAHGRRTLLDVDGKLNREFLPFGGSFVLIRPDRVIASVRPPAEIDDLAFQIREWFAPHEQLVPAVHGGAPAPTATQSRS